MTFRCSGLIPAHAGKTYCRTHVTQNTQAHPRSRGENDCSHKIKPTERGSSPLTRGKQRKRENNDSDTGLIPAHAGKTHTMHFYYTQYTAHPRSRGENHGAVLGRVEPTGSSPLTRGKRVGGRFRTGGAGLIPAHAGKTCAPRSAYA